ncbi:MAG: Crp/Fnr family transcriptional regulator [Xenococcaceae cyanobacterium]
MLLTHNSKYNHSLEIKEPEFLLQFYRKGEEISLFEPGFWLVYRGVVQLSRISANGDEVILGWATINNSFGDCSQDNTDYRAQALCDVYLRWCSPLDITKSPDLARVLMKQLSQRIIKAQNLTTITRLRKVEDRLWQLLLMLKEEIGQSVINGTRLTIRFTHQNLANIICTTRVTVTRLLGDFQSRELICIDRDRHIIILK